MVRRYGGGTSLNVGIESPELTVALAQGIIEAIMPKEARKQAQKQLAMEAIARIYPRISEMPQEERKKLYAQTIFPAYGVYQPPLFRKMFGAQPETILPLPEGAQEVTYPMERNYLPFGLLKQKFTRTEPYIPKGEPLTLAPSPLIHPEHEAELERQAKQLYPESEEDQQSWLKTQKEALIAKIKPSREDVLWESLTRAERLVDAFKQANPGATEEQAISSLPSNLRRRYQEHVEKVATEKAYREGITEDVAARKTERVERMGLLKGREKRFAQQQDWNQGFQERKLNLQDQWKKLAERGKTPQQVYRDALTAYSTYSKNLQSAEREHNKMEATFAKLDPNYLPARFSEPRLSFEDWLRSEGMMFYERMLDLEGKGVGGETTPPTTLPPKREQPKGAFESIQERYLQ